MSAHLSRLRLFQRHLWSLGCAWVWVWDFIHCHTSPRTRSPSSRHPPFTHYPFPPRSLVYGGQPSPHKPRLVISHSTCPPLSSSPHAHSFAKLCASWGPPPSLVFRTEDVWLRCNQFRIPPIECSVRLTALTSCQRACACLCAWACAGIWVRVRVRRTGHRNRVL